jgi:pyridoxine 5-phosphate synthase
MTKLSVNINKIATLRNARGGNNPDIIKTAIDCEKFGAEGITVHPRPDERHIRYRDVLDLAKVITTEFNIEGNPVQSYMDMVIAVKPTQATLVPDAEDVLTSNTGWDTIQEESFLREIIKELKRYRIRTSIFVNPIPAMIEGAAKIGTDRIEFYTGDYAKNYSDNPSEAIKNYVACAELATELGLGINAGHDLDLNNLHYFSQNMPLLAEVSIGHALICDALYMGLENTIQLYLKALE